MHRGDETPISLGDQFLADESSGAGYRIRTCDPVITKSQFFALLDCR
jgi:hypothetical protein